MEPKTYTFEIKRVDLEQMMEDLGTLSMFKNRPQKLMDEIFSRGVSQLYAELFEFEEPKKEQEEQTEPKEELHLLKQIVEELVVLHLLEEKNTKMLSSLFRVQEESLWNRSVSKDAFTLGLYAEPPEFLKMKGQEPLC